MTDHGPGAIAGAEPMRRRIAPVLPLLSVAVVIPLAIYVMVSAREEAVPERPWATAVARFPPPSQVVEDVSYLNAPEAILARLPPVTVRPRVPALKETGMYPCSDCHDEEMPADKNVRTLAEEHDSIELRHGNGRFWCYTCHHETERDALRSVNGQPIQFDQSFLLCAQCHFQQRDFFYGIHGKRLESWRGDRILTPCTECHAAHDPRIKPRAPLPPDRLRAGLLHDKPETPPTIAPSPPSVRPDGGAPKEAL